MVRDCGMAPYAASAREKAIVCLSTDARFRCNSEVRNDGNARAQRKNLGILAKGLGAFHNGQSVDPPIAAALCYSGTTSPEPPNSLGKSFNLVSPSRIGSTVSA